MDLGIWDCKCVFTFHGIHNVSTDIHRPQSERHVSEAWNLRILNLYCSGKNLNIKNSTHFAIMESLWVSKGIWGKEKDLFEACFWFLVSESSLRVYPQPPLRHPLEKVSPPSTWTPGCWCVLLGVGAFHWHSYF